MSCFFFNEPATTEISTLSLHDALPIAGSFAPSRASFATWLYRIARNRATDLDRRRKARPSPVGEHGLYALPGGPRPEEAVDAWDVATALSSIPKEHREVLELAYFDDLSQREISRRTGIPLGTIKSRDRKSVVQGKSVDLGGRRIIKKKTPCSDYPPSSTPSL